MPKQQKPKQQKFDSTAFFTAALALMGTIPAAGTRKLKLTEAALDESLFGAQNEFGVLTLKTRFEGEGFYFTSRISKQADGHYAISETEIPNPIRNTRFQTSPIVGRTLSLWSGHPGDAGNSYMAQYIPYSQEVHRLLLALTSSISPENEAQLFDARILASKPRQGEASTVLVVPAEIVLKLEPLCFAGLAQSDKSMRFTPDNSISLGVGMEAANWIRMGNSNIPRRGDPFTQRHGIFQRFIDEALKTEAEDGKTLGDIARAYTRGRFSSGDSRHPREIRDQVRSQTQGSQQSDDKVAAWDEIEGRM